MRLVRYTYPNNNRSYAPAFPFSSFSGLESEIGRLFDAALGDFASPQGAAGRFPVDLYEDKDNTYVRAELPGVSREDISVETVDDTLTISASRKAKEGEATEAVSLSRSVNIPESVQTDKVTAVYENGVLTVTLPKKEEAKPRKVSVSVN